jgi:hypothetical protein
MLLAATQSLQILELIYGAPKQRSHGITQEPKIAEITEKDWQRIAQRFFNAKKWWRRS